MTKKSKKPSSERPKVLEAICGCVEASGTTKNYEYFTKTSAYGKFDIKLISYEGDINFFDREETSYFRDAAITENPDLVSIRGLELDGLLALRGFNKAGCHKSVVAIHGFASDLIGSNPIKRRAKHFLIERATLRRCTSFYTVSKDAFDRHPWLKKYANKYAGVVYNYIPDFDSSNFESERRSVREELGIDESTPVLVYIGRISFEKGLSDLAATLNLLKDQEFVLLVVGNGPYEEKFTETCIELVEDGKVKFLGAKKDVKPYLFASDIFVFPSLRENHSLSVLEACEAGLYLITSDLPSIRETVLEGVNATLIKTQDHLLFAQTIKKVISERTYCRFDKSAWKRYKKGRFDVDTYSESIERIYREALED